MRSRSAAKEERCVGKFQTYKGKPVRRQYEMDAEHMMVVLYEKDGNDQEKNKRLVVTKDDWRRYSQKQEFTNDTQRRDVVKNTTSCVGIGHVAEIFRSGFFSR
jgi:hypothetical protein